MARIPVTLSALGRLSAGALRAATVLVLVSSCSHTLAPLPPRSQYGFRLAASESLETSQMVDAAWVMIANNATQSYQELAYVLLAMRELGFRIEFNAKELKINGNIISIPTSSDCLATSPLPQVFGALLKDLLGRNVDGAILKTATDLLEYCPEEATNEQ